MTQLMTKTLGTWALVIAHECTRDQDIRDQDSAQTVSELATAVYSTAQVADVTELRLADSSLIGALVDASGDEHYATWGWQSLDTLQAHLEQTYHLLTGEMEFAHD